MIELIIIIIMVVVDESTSIGYVRMFLSPFFFIFSMTSVNSSCSEIFDVSFSLFPMLKFVWPISLRSRKWSNSNSFASL